MLRTFRVIGVAALIAFVINLSVAQAQATRTWVSGVGDDANPGSRTAPCKTFAGAISKTAAGGEIDCIDPGGFGAVTITKSITIDGGGTFASILASGTNGIVINAGANDVVTIRNLSINGAGTGLNGIRFLAGGTLVVENCVIFGFAQKGIAFLPAANSRLLIKDTVLRNNPNAATGGGLLLQPGAAGNATAILTGVVSENNLFGFRAEDRTTVTIRDSVAAANTSQGFLCFSNAAAAVMNLENCTAASNGSIGVRTFGANTTMRISNVTVVNNGTGLDATGGGPIVSFGNNRIAGNGVNGTPSATVVQQ